MKKNIPLALIISRLIIGFVIVVLSVLDLPNYKLIAVILLITGLLTDIFDGVIARQLKISTEKLRRLDSAIDQIFFIAVAAATYIECGDFFKAHIVQLIILFAVEALTYFISFMKFKKEIATHSIGAKVWTLFLVATLVQIIWQCDSGILFQLCFWIGMVTRLEIIAIVLALRKWTNDVPSFYHALKLRKGEEIKRHKMFNG